MCAQEEEMEDNRRKKIVIYWEQYGIGGTDTHLVNLLYGWPNRSDEFYILSNDNNKGLQRIEEEISKLNNVNVISFPSVSNVSFMSRYKGRWFYPFIKVFWYFSEPIFFRRMQKQSFDYLQSIGDVDILISDNGGYPAAWGCLGAVLSAKECEIPTIALLIHHAAVPPKLRRKRFERSIDIKVFDACTHIIAVSEATRQSIYNNRYISKQEKQIAVIYNGIDLSGRGVSVSSGGQVSIKTMFGVVNKLLVGIMGNVLRYKGHEDMISALHLLDDECLSQIHLVIIGEGEIREIERLKSLCRNDRVRNCVTFTGYLPGCSREIISQLDLVAVVTKDFEGFGLTLAEAMSVGTPILATRVGAIPEFVKHLENGFLIAPESPQEIVFALEDFLRNREQWLERVERVNMQSFSRERMGEKFYRLFIN